MPDVIIFDLDGTLIDTAKTSIAAVRECAVALGFPAVSDETVKAAIGMPNPDFYYQLYPDLPRDAVRAFGMEVEHAEARITAEIGESLPFPGVLEMLEALFGAGKTMYIASTGDDLHVHGALSASGLGVFFQDIYCGEADKAGVLRRILARCPGKRAVMVGDTGIDADAAKKNGIPSIGAGYGYCSKDRHSLFTEVAMTAEALLRMLRN